MNTLLSRHPGRGGKKSWGDANSILMFNSCLSLAIAKRDLGIALKAELAIAVIAVKEAQDNGF